MRKIIFILSFASLITFLKTANAELVWNPVDGWQYQGDLSKTFIGDPDEFEQIRDLMNIARDAYEKGKYGKAIKMYRRVWDRHPGSIFAPEALYQTALAEHDRNSYRRAFNALTTIILGYPDYYKYNTVVRLQFSIATDLYGGERARYFWGLLPGFKGYDRAIAQYETMVANAPFSDYAPMALMKASELHIKLNNDIYALDTLDRLINNYPESMMAGDAYLMLAQTFARLVDGPYYDQGATREAISYFEDFLILFPEHPDVKEGEDGLAEMKSVEAQSQMLKGDFYFYKWKDLRAAKVFYNEAITTAPESREAELAKEKLAIIDTKMQEVVDMIRDSLVPTSDDEGVVDPTKF
ncbi:MAG: outer membrane protein assembly factor BamD [Opitutaceae bacterium]|nr:outer membrane protein assembly factor BamD [Opitutaceae bacterium]|tara:strand:+ start:5152 stop:6210 length:1059 start_codon:yes stop_codon:yes gene_type:complete